MKLTKQKLITLTKKELSLLGYQYVIDTVTAAQGLFIKKAKESFYLTLGLTIDRYCNSMFTASFYLSKTTNWASVWSDIPNESYKRAGYFLTSEERVKLLHEQQTKPGIVDAWWDVAEINSLNNFFEAIALTEPRFLNQPGLYDAIQNSMSVNEMAELATEVIERINSNAFNNEGYQFIPLKAIDNIPVEWFKAAETAIKNQNQILNANTVIRLAADAYRQKLIDGNL